MQRHQTTLDAFVANNIDFQVWRPERSGIEVLNCYHFIGSNYFPGFYTETSGRFLANVPEGQRIEVQPFDIIAVSVSDRMQVNSQDSQGMWFSETELTIIPSTSVCLETEPGSNLMPVFTYKPLITAVVGKSNFGAEVCIGNCWVMKVSEHCLVVP